MRATSGVGSAVCAHTADDAGAKEDRRDGRLARYCGRSFGAVDDALQHPCLDDRRHVAPIRNVYRRARAGRGVDYDRCERCSSANPPPT